MSWNAFSPSSPLAYPVKILGWLIRFILISTTCVIGLVKFPWGSEYSGFYWSAWSSLTAVLLFGGIVRRSLERLQFAGRVRQAFGEAGPDRGALISAAQLIRADQELQALEMLYRLPIPATGDVARMDARRLLGALAGTHWLYRQTPFDTLPQRLEAYPQLQALMFCQPAGRVTLRSRALNTELNKVGSRELDEIARSYIAVVNSLISTAENPSAPFHSDAPDLLTMLTGRSHLLHVNERMAAWWYSMKPQLMRGGGALLAGMRLMQRGAFQEAAALLERLAQDGMLLAGDRHAATRGAISRAVFAAAIPHDHRRHSALFFRRHVLPVE